MSGDFEIRTTPLSLRSARQRVECFLSACGLRLDPVDYYAAVVRIGDDEILAGGGLQGSVIKCVAVSDDQRGTGMMQSLLSHLLSVARDRGHEQVRVFTKPQNQDVFESLGFRTIASAPQAVFMENAMGGIADYCKYLAQLKRDGTNGVIVMNANPFTLGHQALVEYAARQVDTLYVIVVREDCSQFAYASRKAMIEHGTAHLDNVVVCEGSTYAISAATFPTYFLKRIDDATETQIALDLDLFARHLSPALRASVRFVGSEPTDELTARYVDAMTRTLPSHGIQVRVLPRIEHGRQVVSASSVRDHLDNGAFQMAAQLVPATTIPFLISDRACFALQTELDTTPKPGLVDKDDNGAHADMDYALMQRSIIALRPVMDQLAVMGFGAQLPSSDAVKRVGLEGERKMMLATGGVNTHRGALFSMGLAVIAAAHTWFATSAMQPQAVMQTVARLASTLSGSDDSHGQRVVSTHRVAGALAMARMGYRPLLESWLPYYRGLAGDACRCHKTLLHVMSELDDTNVIHRVGFDMAQQVKRDARRLKADFSVDALRAMNQRFVQANISPGGAADMLSLTLFIDLITNNS